MDQSVRQCRMCKKLFQSYGSSICTNCTEEMDKAFRKVRDYIYDHPQADIMEITQNTGVPEKWIFDFLKEERLELTSGSTMLTCEQCGAPVQSGKYCKKCKNEFQKIINAADMKIMADKKEAAAANAAGLEKARTHVYVKHNI